MFSLELYFYLSVCGFIKPTICRFHLAWGCTAVFMITYNCTEIKFLNWFAKYTMPIFLMHTLFAAPCRILLFKMGIRNAAMQTSLGIAISFIGPIVVMRILEKMKLDFLVYPGKLKRRDKKSG